MLLVWFGYCIYDIFILYQVASATASPRYVKPLFFLKKIAVFEYMLYY